MASDSNAIGCMSLCLSQGRNREVGKLLRHENEFRLGIWCTLKKQPILVLAIIFRSRQKSEACFVTK